MNLFNQDLLTREVYEFRTLENHELLYIVYQLLWNCHIYCQIKQIKKSVSKDPN